jgi:HNH endonuclease
LVRPEQREALRRLYNFRCGYCGVSEVDRGAELTVDHFQPRSQGGTDAAVNLVYCCHACNEYKGNYYQPVASEHILHPLRDNVPEHILEQEDGTLYALTPTGAFHIAQSHLNRPALIAHRLVERQLQLTRQELLALRQRLAELRREEEEVRRQEEDLGRT